MTWKRKLAASLSFLGLVLVAFFIGRRKRSGEVNMAVARHELDRANRQHEALEQKISDLSARRTEIASDILEEEVLRIQKAAGNRVLTDEEVLDRLRNDGLIQ